MFKINVGVMKFSTFCGLKFCKITLEEIKITRTNFNLMIKVDFKLNFAMPCAKSTPYLLLINNYNGSSGDDDYEW